jgi:predicted TIM-barrel fold metal-dependent hydrolase
MSTAKGSGMLMVDAHAHIWLKGMPLMANPRHKLDYDFSVEQYLQTLDEHGVHFAVIAAASPFGDYNDYTINSVRAHPRLRGTVILEPNVDQYQLAGMNRDGIVGVRLPFISMTTLPDLTTFEYRRTLRRFADLDWHVHLHLDGPRIPQVLPALEASGVKIVIDHFARPDPKLGVNCEGFKMTLRAIEKGRTWVKVSAAYRLGEELGAVYGRELLKQVGSDRLLWASDCPFAGFEGKVTYQQTIDAVLAWVPEGPVRHQVFGGNALKLYFSQ